MKFAFLTGGGKGAAEILKRSLRLRRGAGGQVARAGGVLRHECEIAHRRAGGKGGILGREPSRHDGGGSGRRGTRRAGQRQRAGASRPYGADGERTTRKPRSLDHGVGSPHEMPFSVAAPQHLAESRYSAGWYQPRQNASSQVLLSRMAEMIKPTIE